MSRRSRLRGLMLALALSLPAAFAACSPSGNGGNGAGATDGVQGSSMPSMLDSSPGSSDGMTTESMAPAAS